LKRRRGRQTTPREEEDYISFLCQNWKGKREGNPENRSEGKAWKLASEPEPD